MGTSTDGPLPRTATWRGVKNRMTRAARRGVPSRQAAYRLLQRYINASGGVSEFVSGLEVFGHDRSAQGVIMRVGACLSAVRSKGLNAGCRKVGVTDIVGEPVDEGLMMLFNALAGPANTGDHVDARTGFGRVWRDWFINVYGPAQTYEEVEAVLIAQASNAALANVLTKFCGYYLSAQLQRLFTARLNARVRGRGGAAFLRRLCHYAEVCLHDSLAMRELQSLNDWVTVDWSGEEGRLTADALLEQALSIITTSAEGKTP